MTDSHPATGNLVSEKTILALVPDLTDGERGLDCPNVEHSHILVVEDEPATLAMIEKMLVGAGYRVTGVPDGIAAVDAARADPPDLVLLDLIIPGVDGYGVCALLKRDSNFHASIVVLSGRTSEKDIKAALDAGADALVPKPLDRRPLLAKVAELLAARPLTGPEPTR